ncbi:MAG: class I SAM-dependent methyltransferase [Pseudomonadota bacterium]
MDSLKPVLERWASLEAFQGRAMGDIGCGTGDLLTYLQAQGAVVCGLEPRTDAVSDANMRLKQSDAVVQGEAQCLPWADNTLDDAIFCMSLHHVPAALMMAALDEAVRVVKPHGQITVIEPIADGAGYNVERLIDDEAAVRQAAADALTAFMAKGPVTLMLDERIAWHYDYQSFDGFIEVMVGIDLSRMARARQNREDAERLFHAGGTKTATGWRFPQDYRLLVMRVGQG